MTNFEKYKDEILEVLKTTNKLAVTKDNKIVPCFGTPCSQCILYLKYKGCNRGWKKWADAEYVEPKVFTDAEKAIIKSCEKIKYVARDSDGDLYFYTSKPKFYIDGGFWNCGEDFLSARCAMAQVLTNEPFNAIKVEDKEPTSREEILGVTEEDNGN